MCAREKVGRACVSIHMCMYVCMYVCMNECGIAHQNVRGIDTVHIDIDVCAGEGWQGICEYRNIHTRM